MKTKINFIIKTQIDKFDSTNLLRIAYMDEKQIFFCLLCVSSERNFLTTILRTVDERVIVRIHVRMNQV